MDRETAFTPASLTVINRTCYGHSLPSELFGGCREAGPALTERDQIQFCASYQEDDP